MLCAGVTAAAWGQSLSQNSGINPSDTYCVFDLTLETQATVQTQQPMFNPATNAMAQSFSLASGAIAYHAEMGYDTAGHFVMNLWPTGAAPVLFSMIRVAGGQLTMFDSQGAPIPLEVSASSLLPAALPIFEPALAASVLDHAVVASPRELAQARGYSWAEVSDAPVTYSVTMNVARQSGASATWTYAASGSEYVATQMVYTSPDGSATARMQFSNFGWHDNASADSARAQSGAGFAAPPALGTSGLAMAEPNTDIGCPEEVHQGPGTANILLQHGLDSCAATWDRMYNWLTPTHFVFGTVLIPSLPSLQPLATQQTDMLNRLNEQTGSGYILIGHSQGGLLSRGVADQVFVPGSAASKVTGVITVDTPNQGAPIAENGAVAIGYGVGSLVANLFEDAGCGGYGSPIAENACAIFGGLLSGAGATALAMWGQESAVPATADLIPGSAYLTGLNAASEQFQEAGIISHSSSRWIEMRMLGDFIANPDGELGGRDLVRDTKIIYGSLLADEVYSVFTGNDDQAAYDSGVLSDMNKVDAFYNLLVTGSSSGDSDGVVPAISQTYPAGGALQIPIEDADSHVGSTRSDKVRDALVQALTQKFRLIPQDNCTIDAAPAAADYGPAANNGSIAVTASSSGCGWSVVSSSPWLTVTNANGGGVGSGLATYTIEADPDSASRRATLTFDSAAGMKIVTIDQNSTCTYSLGDTNVVFPAAGGSYSDSVSTQTGCVWAAVPDQTWLTIPYGQTGTSSGYFTYQASPNSGGANLAGAINVMGQSVSVTIGGTSGAAATGSVVIQGSEVDDQYCDPDWPDECSDNYDYGQVTVTVGSFTATAGFGEDSTPSSIAEYLSGLLRDPRSPVTTTWDGEATIYITSKLTGAAYDLPITASYTTSLPDGPSFWVTASGPALTGGQ